ncbi:MAG: hypothetical protein RIT39_1424 [Bacteroidota bacterium]
MEAGETGGVLARGDFLQLPRMEERFDVFTQKGGFFPGVGLWVRPSQLFGAYPVGGIGEGHFQGLAVFANSRCPTAMVKMKVRQDDIGYRRRGNPRVLDSLGDIHFLRNPVTVAKSVILLAAHPAIDHDDPISVLDQQATEGPGAEVVLIRGIVRGPHGAGYHPEHGTAVQFKIACV